MFFFFVELWCWVLWKIPKVLWSFGFWRTSSRLHWRWVSHVGLMFWHFMWSLEGRGKAVLTGVLHCISCVRQRENIYKKLNQVLLYFVVTFFIRRSCLTWPKSMVLSTNLCSTTGLTGCMLKQKSRGSFGGEYKVSTCYPRLVFAWHMHA